MRSRLSHRCSRWLSLLLVVSMLLPSGGLFTPATAVAEEGNSAPATLLRQEAPTTEAIPTPYPTPYWPETAAWTHPQYVPILEPLPEPQGQTITIVPTLVEESTAVDPVPAVELPAFPLETVNVSVGPEGGRSPFASLPLSLESDKGTLAQVVSAQAQMVAPALARQLSSAGIAFRLTFNSADTDHPAPVLSLPQPLRLGVDYSQVETLYGGSFADRLVLYRVSGCEEITYTPQPEGAPLREGDVQKVFSCVTWEEMTGRNDRANRRLWVDLKEIELASPAVRNDETDLAAIDGSTFSNFLYLPQVSTQSTPTTDVQAATAQTEADTTPTTEESGETTRSISSGDSFYVLSSSSNGAQGSYSFTPFANVSDYQVALYTGAATTGYPIPVPPPAAGPAPDVRLDYNSGSVDGMHTHKNNQPGSVGIGWNIQSGSINRHLKTCNLTQAPGDLCLTGDNYSIVLNGVSSRLVKQSGNLYNLQDDPRWKVERFTNGATGHPDAQKEVWWVTTPDGTRYRFGGEIEPETGRDQDSVFYVTIYDTNTATCGNFDYDLCDKAWQWNLDRVEDTNGNVISYFYTWEDNYYKARNDSGSAFRKRYVRAGHVKSIEYSKRSGTNVQPHARVLFHTELRCDDPTTPASCSWPSHYYDTPGDLACEVAGACSQNKPTFWSQRRLDSIQTQVYSQTISSWVTAARYDLSHDFPQPPTDGQGDTSELKLWLSSITQQPGGSFSRGAFHQIEAEEYDAQYGISLEATTDVGRGQNVGWTDDGDYLLFKSVNFGSGANQVLARVASGASGQIEFRLGSPGGTLLGTLMWAIRGDGKAGRRAASLCLRLASTTSILSSRGILT